MVSWYLRQPTIGVILWTAEACRVDSANTAWKTFKRTVLQEDMESLPMKPLPYAVESAPLDTTVQLDLLHLGDIVVEPFPIIVPRVQEYPSLQQTVTTRYQKTWLRMCVKEEQNVLLGTTARTERSESVQQDTTEARWNSLQQPAPAYVPKVTTVQLAHPIPRIIHVEDPTTIVQPEALNRLRWLQVTTQHRWIGVRKQEYHKQNVNPDSIV